MARDEIHVGDIGTAFRATMKDGDSVLDVSSATTKQLIFEWPDGTVDTNAAAFTTDGTDGKIEYLTVSGDLAEAGTMKVQAKVAFVSGTWYSDVREYTVHANLA